MALPPYVIDNNPFQGAFNALGQGIDAYGQAVGQARKRQQGQMVTNALARGDYAGAMSATDSPEMALNIHRQKSADRADARQEGMYGIEKSQRLAQLYGGVAQLVQSEKDPARAAAMWRRVVSAQPEFAGELRKYGIDPGDHSGGAAFLVAQAAGYRDPMESRIRAAQLASADVSRRLSELDLQAKRRDLEQPKDTLQKLKDDEALYRVNPRTGAYERIAGGSNQSSSGVSKEFQGAAGKEMAKIYGGYIEEGQKAAAASVDVGRLSELSEVVGSGAATAWMATAGPYLKSLGIEPRGLSDIQAFEAVINKMAPTLRPVGSGATSDRDMAIFMSSLPSLSQTREGRAAIISHIQRLQEYSLRRAQIASGAMTGQLSPQEAQAEISKLQAPMFARGKQQPQQGGSSSPAVRQSAAAPPQAPPQAIELLRSNPSLRDQFDAFYGPGAADQALRSGNDDLQSFGPPM